MEPIVVYSTDWCGYCRMAKSLLKQKGLEFEEVNVGSDHNKKAEMMRRSGRRTVPQIFFGDRHIGGYTELRDYLSRSR